MDAFADPFGHLLNKEKMDSLIDETIKNFFMYDKTIVNRNGLTKRECHDLALDMLRQLQQNKIRHQEYDDANFETSFQIYQADDLVHPDRLKNFLKSVAD